MTTRHAPKYKDIWLCLSGGNALGAYHGGVYEALQGLTLRPSRIAGASIGAVTGAIIAGNCPENGLSRLREFWELAKKPMFGWAGVEASPLARYAQLGEAIYFGKPWLFSLKLPSIYPFFEATKRPSLFDSTPLCETLERLIDFSRLNDGPVQFIATATDAETGEDVAFDNRVTKIDVSHLAASTAFPIAFPPVTIGGRSYLDPGLSANLPLRALLDTRPERPTLCAAIDLFSASGRKPESIEEAVCRTQDLVFSRQSARAIEAVRRNFASEGSASDMTLLHLAYRGDGEIGGKMLDYSNHSVNRRWHSGATDIRSALSALPKPAGFQVLSPC